MMIRIGIKIFVSFSVIGMLFAGNRDIKFDHLSMDQGLSQNTVVCILQDSQGFMWFGSDEGLNRYDGYDFKTYYHDANDPGSLSQNRIKSLCEDRYGVLWIGTYGGGLNKFIPEEEKFTRYTSDPNNPGTLSDNSVISIYEDSSGILWIGTYSGLNKFDRAKGKFTSYRPEKIDADDPDIFITNWITSICEDSTGQFWIGTVKGLYKFDRVTCKFSPNFFHPGTPGCINNTKITSICEERPGLLWIGTYSGVKIFDSRKGKIIRNEIDIRVESIVKDAADYLWIGTMDGLFKFNRESDSFEHFQHHPENTRSLGCDLVLSIHEDRAGVMWLGTFSGVDKFDNKKKKFAHYKPFDSNSNEKNFVASIHEDKSGALWIGTFGGGLTKLDGQKGINVNYRNNPDDPCSLSDSRVTSILESLTGKFWVGTNNGLNKFDPSTGKFYHYLPDSNDPDSLSNGYILSLFEDGPGKLWVGTLNGLNKFDKKNETFVVYNNEPGNPDSLSNNKISALYEDRSGVFWVGTYGGGLNKFDRETGRSTRYRHAEGDPHSLSSNKIYSIHEYPSGVLWIGTNSGGLNKFNKETGAFVNYTKKDGLPNNVVFGILEDNRGNLWLSTNGGLSKFNPKTETFRNYVIDDGMQGYEFSPGNSYCKSKSGEMFFGGSNGFNAFYPENVKDNPYIPRVVITSFFKYNEEGKRVSIPVPVTGELRLSYTDRFFSIGYAALDYTAPQRNKYTYKLEGFHDKWIKTDRRCDISFTSLPPGEYVFKVKGSNSDGTWDEEGAEVKIIIAPPFWQTKWFYSFIALILFGSSFLLQKRRLMAFEFRLRKEHEMNELLVKHNISKREKQIVHSILTGKSNKDIENELFISSHTVKNHVYNIFRKFGVKNRGELVLAIKSVSTGTHRKISHF